MDLFSVHKSDYLSQARNIAKGLITSNGSTHTRAVIAEMQRLQMIASDGKQFWAGAMFRSKEFRWTGQWHTYSDSARNIHERTIRTWTLA